MNDSISLVKQLLREWLLSEDFTILVAEISAAYEGFEIGPPAVVYTHERVVAPERFPAVELLGLNSTPTSESSAQIYRHSINALWTVAGDDEDVVVKTIEGLILATRRLTWRRTLPMPDGTSAPVIPGAEDYGPLTSRSRTQTQPLVKGATIRLTVPTFAGVL